MPLYTCQPCSFIATLKGNYTQHLGTERHKHIKAVADKYAELESTLRDTFETTTADLHHTIEEQDVELEKLREDMEELKRTLKSMTEQRDMFKTMVEKAALKVTTVNNIKNTKTTNTLNILSTEPIKFSTFKSEVPKIITAELCLTTERKFAGAIRSALLQDRNGQNKLVCTDRARKSFQYVDEITGKLVSDPGLVNLVNALKSGVSFNTLAQDILDELNSKGGSFEDNMVEAQKYLKRARMESGFVDQMAKNTYKGAILAWDDTPSLSVQ